MKFKYLSIFIAIGSLLLLYVLSLFSQPILVPLSSLQTYNGQQVTVQGVVTDHRTTSYGSQLITIKEPQNSTNSIALYLEGELSVEYGDLIQATGEIQQYNNQWELVINDPQLVVILQRWQNQSLSCSSRCVAATGKSDGVWTVKGPQTWYQKYSW